MVLDKAIQAEIISDACSPGLPEFQAKSRIAGQPKNGFREALRIACRHNQTGLTVDHGLRIAADRYRWREILPQYHGVPLRT